MPNPQIMKVYKCQGKDLAELVEAPLPKLRPGYVLVKVTAIALNPTDWKHIHQAPEIGATIGVDFAGKVVEIGPEVQRSWEEGDRIAGACHGSNVVEHEDGAFGEYALVKDGICMKIPDHVSDMEAATFGVGITTVGQALYQTLKLPSPNQPATNAPPILIYGGSTATGLLALQFAKLSGFKTITTCSPKNFDLVKTYGADLAFDYSDSAECSRQIREAAGEKLKHAMDCISNDGSSRICADSMAGGQYTALLPVNFPKDDIQSGFTLVSSVYGEPYSFAGQMQPEGRKDHWEFGSGFWQMGETLLVERKFKIVPIDDRGDWRDVMRGMEDLRQNKIRGMKLVYRVSSDR